MLENDQPDENNLNETTRASCIPEEACEEMLAITMRTILQSGRLSKASGTTTNSSTRSIHSRPTTSSSAHSWQM